MFSLNQLITPSDTVHIFPSVRLLSPFKIARKLIFKVKIYLIVIYLVCLLFLQAVACSLYVVGFGESIAGLIGQDSNVWISRGIGAAVIFLLLGKLDYRGLIHKRDQAQAEPKINLFSANSCKLIFGST